MNQVSLPHAASRRKLPSFSMALEMATDLEEVDQKGRTALFVASRLGKRDILDLLIERGANPNQADVSGESPLQVATRYGRVDCAELLLSAGADIDYCNVNGDPDYRETALGTAVRKEHREAFELLCSGGADSNVSSEGRTPLMIAAVCEETEFVQRLIEVGADVRSKDMSGDTPLHWACRHLNSEVARILIGAGALVNATNERGETPLHCSLSFDDKAQKVVEILLRAEPDLSIRDGVFGCTPAERAVRLGRPELALLFGEGIPEEKSEAIMTVRLTPEDLAAVRAEAETEAVAVGSGPTLIRGSENYEKAIYRLVPELSPEDKSLLNKVNCAQVKTTSLDGHRRAVLAALEGENFETLLTNVRALCVFEIGCDKGSESFAISERAFSEVKAVLESDLDMELLVLGIAEEEEEQALLLMLAMLSILDRLIEGKLEIKLSDWFGLILRLGGEVEAAAQLEEEIQSVERFEEEMLSFNELFFFILSQVFEEELCEAYTLCVADDHIA